MASDDERGTEGLQCALAGRVWFGVGFSGGGGDRTDAGGKDYQWIVEDV